MFTGADWQQPEPAAESAAGRMVWELRDGPDLVGLHLRRADAEADQGILRAQRRVTADGGPVLPGLLDGDLDITVSATVVHAGRQQHLDGPT